MKKALFLTAYNRLRYLQQALYTWEDVRGLEDWHVVFMIEPSEITQQITEECELFIERTGLTDYEIIVNPERYGVLHHPWVGFERLFEKGYQFVLRVEDDLIVSTDILEYFTWAAESYRGDEQIATVNGCNFNIPGSDDEVELSPAFNPLIWGTWRNRWVGAIGPTWDHDYSTYNGTPGNQSGWDWNLNTRLFPELDLRSLVPSVSRVDNIGVYGTHSTMDNYERPSYFKADRGPVKYRLAASGR